MNIFTSLDPSVKKLLGWKLGDEEEKWALKAVESLVKKLRKKKNGQGTVDDLEYALAHPGSRSRCVTIPRSLDGRLQVSHRKGLPHVIYCRVWRWPNVQSHHELKPVPECMFPYDNRNEFICINPYHYQRIEPQPSTIIMSPPLAAANPMMNGSTPNGYHRQYVQATTPPGFPLPITPPSQGYYDPNTPNGNVHMGSTGSSPQPMDLQYHSPYSSASSPSQAASVASPSLLSDDDDFVAHQQHIMNSMPPPVSRRWDEPEYWCSICYYELNSRVGEPFKISCGEVVVDGYTDPSNQEGRICLGLLSNVNRNVTIENTRRHIGKGVKFACNETSVTVINMSESPVFIQSRNANFKYNLLSTAVCRVPSNSHLVIFDYVLFHRMLEKAKTEGYSHLYELQKMCFIRMSFVKGWGADYHRQDVTSTPCWIEMQLHQPLSWIDAAISPMDPPDNMNVTSVS
ncbi:Smad1 [Aphelenchoides avenae]|nr:Smad1 [Aphelenchus avenae]